ncbi:hypothetical protein PHYSODRAFT_286058 [Phytophthora sojae]|uniref:RxLR effector protein n=2 Tax=Phytophthora sojae TaxID=67593 RepID=G4ZCT0_PHYSP|nr:hypothetical protein PHYSODRAFT_286058 [Phytophthora sojae]AEK80852.1 Avh181 [Phytophthora sojae]AEK80853.1 Avh181 [Phytophthora sojae]EGZ18288.1 hypothetical protein PHYSODRAFT_286058 [Phytophthora sojae]|eukprot:XP_009527346.1 hypothetical protein PHYSODRAFT_286058 [Phytophthora sojae]
MRLADLALLVATLFIASCNALSSSEQQQRIVPPGADIPRSLAAASEDITVKSSLRYGDALAADENDEERGLSSLKAKIGALFNKLKYKYWVKRGKSEAEIYNIWVKQGKTDKQIYNLLAQQGNSDRNIYDVFLRQRLSDAQIYFMFRRFGKSDDEIYKIWKEQRRYMSDINRIWLRVGKTDEDIYKLLKPKMSMNKLYNLWLQLQKSDEKIYNIWLKENVPTEKIYAAWFSSTRTPDSVLDLLQNVYKDQSRAHMTTYVQYRSYFNENYGIREW